METNLSGINDEIIRVKRNLEAVQEKIRHAAARAGRDENRIKLVVVTKAQPIEVVRSAIQAGARFLGENYAEQAVPKIEALGHQAGVEWHMIGHVQSRKARLVCAHFDWMHSLDSLKLARIVDSHCRELNRTLPVLLEFNLGGEESKSGWDASNPNNWPGLSPDLEEILSLSHLRVSGLMTMPPLGLDPEESRPYFSQLRQMQQFLSNRYPHVDWDELSMGTSADFEIAVEEQATLVRVGQAILGPRLSRM